MILAVQGSEEELERQPEILAWDMGIFPRAWMRDRKSMATEAGATREVTNKRVLCGSTETPRRDEQGRGKSEGRKDTRTRLDPWVGSDAGSAPWGRSLSQTRGPWPHQAGHLK